MKINLTSLDLNHSKTSKLIMCGKNVSKVSTCPSEEVSYKSTCPEAKFTCHGQVDKC